MRWLCRAAKLRGRVARPDPVLEPLLQLGDAGVAGVDLQERIELGPAHRELAAGESVLGLREELGIARGGGDGRRLGRRLGGGPSPFGRFPSLLLDLIEKMPAPRGTRGCAPEASSRGSGFPEDRRASERSSRPRRAIRHSAPRGAPREPPRRVARGGRASPKRRSAEPRADRSMAAPRER